MPELFDLLAAIVPANRFYAAKLAKLDRACSLIDLPFTTKAELIADQERYPPYGSNLTLPFSSKW